jgi:streptogramin lyase
MKLRRRDFLGTALAAGAAAVTAPNVLHAQDEPAGGGRGNAPQIPTHVPKVEKLFKSPDRYPNALEAMPDGLWVGDQVSERVLKLDWQTGKVLENFIAEAHNTSGIAVGDGYLWIGCNGAGTAAATRPFTRPFDKSYGEIVKCDMKTGKQVWGFRSPWGSTHGTAWAHDTNHLWAVAPGMSLAVELDPKDDLRILKMVSIGGGTPHGIELYDGSLWILAAADRLVRKMDMSGKVQEIWKLATEDPDPHGMCIHDGYVYYCDAGLGGGREPSPGTVPQMICRFPIKS